jgi:hypothetical protein
MLRPGETKFTFAGQPDLGDLLLSKSCRPYLKDVIKRQGLSIAGNPITNQLPRASLRRIKVLMELSITPEAPSGPCGANLS